MKTRASRKFKRAAGTETVELNTPRIALGYQMSAAMHKAGPPKNLLAKQLN